MPKRFYGDFSVGDRTESGGRTVSESEVYRYAGLVGSYGRLHTNKAYMASTEHGQLLVQGPLALSYLYGFTTNIDWQPETLALYGIDGVRFLKPLFIDETVHLEMAVESKEVRNERSGTVTFDASLVKEDGTVVVVCDWILLVERRQ